jgi:hypothetical protein
MIALLWLLLLAGCGAGATAVPKPTPIASPTPTPDVAAPYISAIDTLHDSLELRGHNAAYYSAKVGSPETSAAAQQLAVDFTGLLDMLDAIPFPSSASADVSTLKKAVVARQVFWSEVGIADSNYSAFTDNSTSDAYNQASILLGHDIGVTLVLQSPSPTPS